jgi:hypothetical protein
MFGLKAPVLIRIVVPSFMCPAGFSLVFFRGSSLLQLSRRPVRSCPLSLGRGLG